MFPRLKSILVMRTLAQVTALAALGVLSGCGQRGPLFLPPDSTGQASLPQTLRPGSSAPSSTSSTPASAPAPARAP